MAHTRAQNVTAGVLSIEYEGTGPLFSETNLYPGYEKVRTITVTNNGKVAHSFSIAVDGQLGKLAEVLQIEPRNFETKVPFWNKTINNIAKDPNSAIIVGSIAPGETRKVDMAAILPITVGNDYQDTSTFSFDFVVGNESTDQEEPTDISLDLNNLVTINAQNNAEKETRGNQEIAQNPDTNAGEVANEAEEKVAGTETENKNPCFWWWALPLFLALFLTIYGYSAKSRNWFYAFWPIFAGAIVLNIHWILHQYFEPVKGCDYTLWITLGELVVYYFWQCIFSEEPETG